MSVSGMSAGGIKKGQIIEADMTDMRFPQTGIGLCGGERVRVKGGVPGTVVTARVTRTKPRLEAALVPRAVEGADCPAFGLCGGCTFRSVPYADEARLKERMALELLEAAGVSGYAYDGFAPAHSAERYRNKMEFSFGDDGPGGGLTLGLRKRGSFYEAVNADCCLICPADFNAVVSATRAHFAGAGAAFYHRGRKTGALRHLVLRQGLNTGEMLVNLVTAPGCGLDLPAYVKLVTGLLLNGRVVSIYHTETDSAADVIKPEGARLIYGGPYFTERLGGLAFRVTPFSFFQTNTAGAERLYGTALDYAGDLAGKRVYDLYCGTGTIAQLAARRGAAGVVGVELVAEAAEAARRNAEQNGLGNCEFIAGDVLQAAAELPGRPDVVIIDPPRDGAHPKALPKLAALGAGTIVYVSCNPVTLARDLALFAERGYRPARLRFHDMFPRAAHLETAVRLEAQ